MTRWSEGYGYRFIGPWPLESFCQEAIEEKKYINKMEKLKKVWENMK